MAYLDSFDAFIFDFDGTLVDSMPLWENFCGDWLRGMNKTPDDSLEDDIKAMTIAQSADYVNQRYGMNLSRAELIRQWEDVMLPRYAKAALKQGAADLVRGLAARGKKLGIATYSFPRCVESVLERHGLRRFFSSMLYAHEFEDESNFTSVKKDPAFWRRAAAGLLTAPEKCVVFEDSFSSLEGGRAAGMGIVGIYDASSERWPLLKASADLALDFPGEALQLY